MRPKKTISEWLTNRYLLIIRNEENFAEKVTISFNYARLLILVVFLFIATLGFSIFLVTTLLESWLDPRYANTMLNRQLVELSIKIDSLEQDVAGKERFIFNIQRILDGTIEDVGSSSYTTETSPVVSGDPLLRSVNNPIDSLFRAEYEQGDLGLITLTQDRREELTEIYLFTPIRGIVTARFDPRSDHYGTDIVAAKNEPIKAIADGIVVFSSWTLDGGYVIAIQHKGNLLSVYKHNSELLKSVGTFVSTGDVVAILGNTGELTTGPHLHFELWHKGTPVDPENFFNF